MNWKITMLEYAEFGWAVFALWIPFRMGRAQIGFIWSALVGWLALFIWALSLEDLSLAAGNLVDSGNTLPDGQIGAPILLFGWLVAWAAADCGKKSRKWF